MSRLARLSTLADARLKPRAIPKPSTKLARAIAAVTAQRLDDTKLQAWARKVKNRDEWKDRKTGQAVKSTRRLHPLRAEAHHIEPKDNRAVRYDVRNGITLSFATHFLVTTHVYRIEGTKFFRKGGATYIDGTYPVTFVRL